MGQRQNNILKLINPEHDFSSIKIPKLEDYKTSSFYDEIFNIYKQLGGIQNEIPFGIKPKNLDFVINGKILELDEENHFNRYRKLTLQASIYRKNRIFNSKLYTGYCDEYEDKCQMRGGYWTSRSSEKAFGVSGNPKDFTGNGSARFKQRAFYDLLKDHIQVICGIPIKRLAIYDIIEINGDKVILNKILKSHKPEYVTAVKSIIDNYVR